MVASACVLTSKLSESSRLVTNRFFNRLRKSGSWKVPIVRPTVPLSGRPSVRALVCFLTYSAVSIMYIHTYAFHVFDIVALVAVIHNIWVLKQGQPRLLRSSSSLVKHGLCISPIGAFGADNGLHSPEE